MPASNPPNLAELQQLLAQGAITRAQFDGVIGVLAMLKTAAGAAVAQGQGSQAVAAQGVIVDGDNHAPIHTGNILHVYLDAATRSGAKPDALQRGYFARLLLQMDRLPLTAGDAADSAIRLSAVYTALLTDYARPGAPGLRGGSDDLLPVLDGLREGRPRAVSALEALNAERCLVLLGEPGGGKSTFVNIVTMAMVGELLGGQPTHLAQLTAPVPQDSGLRRDKPPKPQRWDHGPLWPVPLVLRDLALHLARAVPSGQAADAQLVWQFIEQQLAQAGLADFAPQLRQHLLTEGGLILLDGLDEVPDAQRQRGPIKQAIQGFADTFSRCRFLVTSRTYAYQRQDWKLSGFAEARLLPFTQPQINGFIKAWYGHMVELLCLTAADAQRRAEALQHDVARNPRIRELAERPLLLTLMAQLQTKGGGALPQKREALYDLAVNMLLHVWERMKPRTGPDGQPVVEPSLAEWLNASHDNIRKQLNRLAFEAHRDQAPDSADEPVPSGAAPIPQAALVYALRCASDQFPDAKLLRLEEYLRDRAGILAEHGVGVYQFPHRSFQEYLAACHLTDDDFPDQLASLARQSPERWREVVLLAGAKAARGSASNPWLLAQALCDGPAPAGAGPNADTADAWGALLAGQVLAECTDRPAKLAPRLQRQLDQARAWQLALMRQSPLPAAERALAGRSLAALGDPRPEVGSLAGMQFCWVPAGPFTMGDDDSNKPSKPRQPVVLAQPYAMGRYPVTVAQWRDYLAASGRQAEDPDSLAGDGNAPAVRISWHEASTFCQYLTATWRAVLPAGVVVALPTGAEWEKAARGGHQLPAKPVCVDVQGAARLLGSDAAASGQVRNPMPDRAFPWGADFEHERANTGRLGRTSAVGCFPAGASPVGCEDMAGNVLEWTGSRGLDDAHQQSGPVQAEAEERVVRGGAFNGGPDDARCAWRYRSRPGFRFNFLGFRVVLRWAPVFDAPAAGSSGL